MPSSLAWLNHDQAAQERTRRILGLFQEKGTRDQLGIGGIRDALSDLLFPGTSTIQTRLRYFLIVPWVYVQLEEEGVPANRFGTEARRREVALIQPLLSVEEEGVFGRSAGGDLKRLPSDVYWGGLGEWGIRRFSESRGVYHRAVDEIYRRRRAARHVGSEGTEPAPGVVTWHPELPLPPPGFPDDVNLTMTREESEFLSDRILTTHPGSLLAWLVLRAERTSVDYPWEHPRFGELLPEHQRTLTHGRIFSEVMHGAALLHNRMLAEEANRAEVEERHRESFEAWAAALDVPALGRWSVSDLFATARGQGGYRISPHTEEFVGRWVNLVRDGPHRIPERSDARSLIRNREMRLKGARSFFRNRRGLEERYSGAVGLGRLGFRWSTVQDLLNDLHDGLNAP
jgi:hypothetical protein